MNSRDFYFFKYDNQRQVLILYFYNIYHATFIIKVNIICPNDATCSQNIM